ncbi:MULTISPECIES: hypothetical protein [Mameliella]|uniref:hypothetical protein n=1 Tax=Mameliella TaxID=1434019 RepID=UPI000B536FAC|nr:MULTISPECIES: hypothetical protein [Mameliella]MCR9273715.1 hypothetical protein [Paracoccaceae bacterium]OWV56757.1 hypothetical protein CDZ98_17205 [Mameliella alba]
MSLSTLYSCLPFIALILAWLCRLAFARVVLIPVALLILSGHAQVLWTDRYLRSIGCHGNVLKGMTCPEWPLLARIAYAHQEWGLFSALAGMTLLPTLMLVVVVAEGYERVVARKANP